jgi:hypothetical protein
MSCNIALDITIQRMYRKCVQKRLRNKIRIKGMPKVVSSHSSGLYFYLRKHLEHPQSRRKILQGHAEIFQL